MNCLNMQCRGDAAFSSPQVYEYLEENGILYAIRIAANGNLYPEIEHLLTRPVGRPPKKPRVFYQSLLRQEGKWGNVG